MEDRHPIGDMVETVMEKLKGMVDVNTIVGAAITTVDGITIIPVCKVNFALGTGGGDFSKKPNNDNNFAFGNASGVTITPVSFLVVKDGNIRLLNISTPASGTLDRLVELLPEVVDKLSDMIGKRKEESDFEEE